jgi:hypothetical protein
MKEFLELRVREDRASLLFDESEGKKLGGVRRVVLPKTDPRITRIGDLQRELKAKDGRPFFFGWQLRHKYSRAEIERAEVLYLRIPSVFEPSGEECGTQYDDTCACPVCGSGAVQLTPLRLDTRRIPKSKDISETIGGEIVVSEQFYELSRMYKLSGLHFREVESGHGRKPPKNKWFQLNAVGVQAHIHRRTSVGINPFNLDASGEFRCSKGDLLGLNLLSEVFLTREPTPSEDVFCTAEFIGVRRGLLRPQRLLLVTPRAMRIMLDAGVKGCAFDVAHYLEG